MSIKKKLSALLILWSFIVLFAGNTIVFLAFLYFSRDRLETSLENSAEQLAESVGSGDALFSDPEPILHTHVPDEGMIRLFNAQHQKAFDHCLIRQLECLASAERKGNGNALLIQRSDFPFCFANDWIGCIALPAFFIYCVRSNRLFFWFRCGNGFSRV